MNPIFNLHSSYSGIANINFKYTGRGYRAHATSSNQARKPDADTVELLQLTTTKETEFDPSPFEMLVNSTTSGASFNWEGYI